MFGVERLHWFGWNWQLRHSDWSLLQWWRVGWLWLDLWDGVEGSVLYALGDGGEGLSRWVVGLVLIEGLIGAFVWVETLAGSSWWHR
jgi:hypothetical protein